MMKTSRRSILRGAGVTGAALLAGCSSPLNSGPPAGALVVENDHSLPHVLDLAVVDGPETSSAVEQGLSGTFSVEPDDRKVYEEFLADAGTYVIEATFDGETEEIEYQPMAGSGRVLTVSVSGSGELDWTVSSAE